ncbi:MAG: DUF1223 domain-containing protein [Pseudomonadota bacterium]
MTRLAATIWSLLTVLAAPALANERVVVVELFTSQGCYSCPPADDILLDIHNTHDDVLALSLHVDYWDYLGWKDVFAQPQFTARQAAYNENLNSRYRLVTPQMVFDGQDHVAGAHTVKILKAVTAARENADKVDLNVAVQDGQLTATLAPIAGSVASDVYLVRYIPSEKVKIDAGENGGKNLKYSNIVREWSKIGEWNGSSAASFEARLDGDDNAAVIVQVAGSGPVLGARKLSSN